MADHDELLEFMDVHHVAHLATTGAGGPHCAAVFYVRLDDRPTLAWISDVRVLHSLHLAENPAMALSIAPSAPALARIEGIQMRGRAELAADQAAVAEAYFTRFPPARAMAMTSSHYRFWRFEPTWIRFVRRIGGVSSTRDLAVSS